MLYEIALASYLIAAPNPTLTPGAVRTTDLAQICTYGYYKKHRSWHRQKQTLAKYGVPWDQRFAYEDDDWFPVELGGDNRKPENHWAQPLAQAIKKNRLENYIHKEACANYKTTGNRDAYPYLQRIVDWPNTYKQVFGVEP